MSSKKEQSQLYQPLDQFFNFLEIGLPFFKSYDLNCFEAQDQNNGAKFVFVEKYTEDENLYLQIVKILDRYNQTSEGDSLVKIYKYTSDLAIDNKLKKIYKLMFLLEYFNYNLEQWIVQRKKKYLPKLVFLDFINMIISCVWPVINIETEISEIRTENFVMVQSQNAIALKLKFFHIPFLSVWAQDRVQYYEVIPYSPLKQYADKRIMLNEQKMQQQASKDLISLRKSSSSKSPTKSPGKSRSSVNKPNTNASQEQEDSKANFTSFTSQLVDSQKHKIVQENQANKEQACLRKLGEIIIRVGNLISGEPKQMINKDKVDEEIFRQYQALEERYGNIAEIVKIILNKNEKGKVKFMYIKSILNSYYRELDVYENEQSKKTVFFEKEKKINIQKACTSQMKQTFKKLFIEKINVKDQKYKILSLFPPLTKSLVIFHCESLSSTFLENLDLDIPFLIPQLSKSVNVLDLEYFAIYLLGGHQTNKTYIYYQGEHTLLPKASMIAASERKQFGIVSINSYFYVIGGVTDDEITAACERYDVLNDTWTSIAPLREPVADTNVAMWNQQFIIRYRARARLSSRPAAPPRPNSALQILLGQPLRTCLRSLSLRNAARKSARDAAGNFRPRATAAPAGTRELGSED